VSAGSSGDGLPFAKQPAGIRVFPGENEAELVAGIYDLIHSYRELGT
jgi:hypothetical protein